MMQASSKSHQGTIATLVAVLVALFACSKLFRALEQSIETIWEVEAPDDRGIWQTVVRYVVTESLTTIIILTLLAIVIGESFVSTVVTTLAGQKAFVGLLIRFGNVVLVTALLTPLIAALFRWLPRTESIAWRDVWLGAAVTAVATTVGQVAIAWYISVKNESAMYGSAASVIVVLLWLYYSAYIFLFGAELRGRLARPYAARGRLTAAPAGPPGVPLREPAAAQRARVLDGSKNDHRTKKAAISTATFLLRLRASCSLEHLLDGVDGGPNLRRRSEGVRDAARSDRTCDRACGGIKFGSCGLAAVPGFDSRSHRGPPRLQHARLTLRPRPVIAAHVELYGASQIVEGMHRSRYRVARAGKERRQSPRDLVCIAREIGARAELATK